MNTFLSVSPSSECNRCHIIVMVVSFVSAEAHLMLSLSCLYCIGATYTNLTNAVCVSHATYTPGMCCAIKNAHLACFKHVLSM